MNIELSSGKNFSNVSEDVLRENFQLLKSGEDFLILDDSGSYIQCAVSEPGTLVFEYQDSTGHYSGSSAVSFERGEEIMLQYLKRDSSWKNNTDWVSDGGYEQESPSFSSERQGTSSDSSMGGEQKDEPLSIGGIFNTLKKTAKKEVKRAVEKKTSGIVKDVFRKFTK